MTSRPREGGEAPELETARQLRTVRNLATIRWLAIVWAAIQVFTFYLPYPEGVLPWAIAAVGVLAVGNTGIWLRLGRARTATAVRTLALASVLVDGIAIVMLVYVYTLNNLPIDVMQGVLGGGRIIAVDIRRRVELTMQAAVGPTLSGWQVLLKRARRGPEPFDPPRIGTILARSVELAGLINDRAVLDRPGLDLYLTPPGGRIGLLDFDAAPLLVEQAYRYTRDRLSELEAGALANLTTGR